MLDLFPPLSSIVWICGECFSATFVFGLTYLFYVYLLLLFSFIVLCLDFDCFFLVYFPEILSRSFVLSESITLCLLELFGFWGFIFAFVRNFLFYATFYFTIVRW